MYRTKRLQNQITASRFTLPTSILISVTCWLLTTILLPDLKAQPNHYLLWDTLNFFSAPSWANRLFSFLLYSVIAYFLIEMNNTFAIIRMRASIQTAIYLLLIAVCPNLHILYAGDWATIAFLIALFFLFKSYQQLRPAASLFHSFLFLGIGSLFFPQLALITPLFWIGAHNFQSLQPKSFFASLVGWSTPYWLFLGYAYYSEQMELFYQPFLEMAKFTPIYFDLQPWVIATLGYLFILFVVSASHYLATGYEDKIRTRSYLNFLIFLNISLFTYIGLQPALSVHLLSLLFIGVSILAGHLFVLAHSRTSNIFSICMLVLLLPLFIFNLWTLL